MSNKKIIKSFLEKMATQDNRCTAAPYFYVIRTEIETQADPDNCDIIRYYDAQNCEHTYDSPEDCEKELKREGYNEDEINEILGNLVEFGVRKEWKHKRYVPY